MNDDVESEKEGDGMLTLREGLIQSAPQPGIEFQERLVQRLIDEIRQDNQRAHRIIPRRLASRRAAIALFAVLTIGAGVVFAISTALQQFIRQDSGLAAVYQQGLGHEIGIRQTLDGFTVTVEWAYADGNRLTLAYAIQGHPGVQYTNLIGDDTLADRANGAHIPLIKGWNALLDSNGALLEADALPVSDHSVSVLSYDLGVLHLQGRSSLDLRLEVLVEAITIQQRTQVPMERFDEMNEGPDETFIFEFSVPLVSDQRLFDTPLMVTDNDVTLTLRQVTVSPSQVRVVLCLVPPASERKWTAIPRLTADGRDVAGGGAVTDIVNVGEAAGQTCMQFRYDAGMFDYTGSWRLEISELVGFGSGGGNDQQRIAGSWVFEFIVP